MRLEMKTTSVFLRRCDNAQRVLLVANVGRLLLLLLLLSLWLWLWLLSSLLLSLWLLSLLSLLFW